MAPKRSASLADLDATKRGMLWRYLDEHARATRFADVLLELEARATSSKR